MCKLKIAKVLIAGIISINCVLVGVNTYANPVTENILISENFNKIETYNQGLFNDVTESDWYAKDVTLAYELGLMTGDGEKRFNPKGNMTIAQTITVASRIHAINTTGKLDGINKDTKVWYEGALNYAIENGIISKSDFNKGDMNKPATRGQVAYILSNCLPEDDFTTVNNEIAFKDVKGNNKYKDSILKLAEAGVVSGYEGGEFKPNNKVSRAEASVFISRLVRPSNRVEFKTDNNSSDKVENSSDIYYTSPNGKQFLLKRGDTPISNKTVYVTETNEYGQTVYDTPSQGLTPITVKYGRHTYGSNNQAEYDKVISVVEEILRFEGSSGKKLKSNLDKFWEDQSYQDRMMKLYPRTVGAKTPEEAFKFYMLEQACGVVSGYTSSQDGVGDSAYAQIIGGEGDCTADAMTNSLVMDIMGYNSKTVANNSQSHEWMVVEVDGVWRHFPSAGFTKDRAYDIETTEATRK